MSLFHSRQATPHALVLAGPTASGVGGSSAGAPAFGAGVGGADAGVELVDPRDEVRAGAFLDNLHSTLARAPGAAAGAAGAAASSPAGADGAAAPGGMAAPPAGDAPAAGSGGGADTASDDDAGLAEGVVPEELHGLYEDKEVGPLVLAALAQRAGGELSAGRLRQLRTSATPPAMPIRAYTPHGINDQAVDEILSELIYMDAGLGPRGMWGREGTRVRDCLCEVIMAANGPPGPRASLPASASSGSLQGMSMEGVADLVGTAVRAAVESQAGRPQSTGPSSASAPSIPPLADRFIEAAERGLLSELDEMFDRYEVANRTVLGSLRHEIVTLGRVPQEARVALARMTPLADASGELCGVASTGKFVQGADGSVTYVASSDAEGKEAQSVSEELHKLRILLQSCVLVSMDLDTSQEAAPGELATVRRLAARCPRGETLAVSPSAVRQFLAAAELLRSWQLRTVRHVVGGALATWRRRANNPVELDRYSISAALRKGGRELRALALAGEAAQVVPADASAAAAAGDAASAPPGKVIISEGHYEDLKRKASGKRKTPDDGGKPKLPLKGGTKGGSKCKNKRHEAEPNNTFCTKSHAHFQGWRAQAPAQAPAPAPAPAQAGT